MTALLLVLMAIVGLLIGGAALVLLSGVRTKGSLARSLDMVLFSFALPRFAAPGGREQDDKKLISVMEQLYASVATLKAKGWNKFLYGDPYIALEMAVPHIGEQIHFYVAVPSRFADQFERQVHGTFPNAEVVRAPDYNIFNPAGAASGGYLKLKETPILPFQTYTDLPTDPLGPLVGAFGSVEDEGEGAALQLIVRPSAQQGMRKLAQDTARLMQSGNDFFKALKLAKNPKKEEKKDKDPTLATVPKVATEFEQKLIKSLTNKASRPMFDCDIRILTSAVTPERADQLRDQIMNAFGQFAAPDLNSFKLEGLKGKALERLVFQFAFRLFESKQSMPLSSEEVSSIYHFPVGSAILPKVRFSEFKKAEAPAGMPSTGTIFGMNVYHGVETPLRLTRDDRRRHMYIIGQTGTGKTVTMQTMMAQDLANGEGVTLLDPHGEFAEWTLANVPKERADDVIYFNPADVQYPMGLNMLEFDTSNPQDKSLIIDELFEIMDKLYNLKESGGPQFERYFKNSLFLLLDNYERSVPTLSDVSRVFVDEAYRNDLLAHETNQIVKQFWELEATKTTGDQSLVNFAGYITSKIDAFTSNDFLRPIIQQTRSVIDFKDVIENRKILIVNLSKGKIGDMNSSLLGMIILGKLRRIALARDTTRKDMPDHYVYMDEFQNFSTKSINVILAEARKYRLALIMAHQFIKQLSEDIAGAVFGNVGTMIFFRISSEDAEDVRVKTKLAPVFDAGDIVNLAMGNSYVTMLVNGQVGRPTSSRGLFFEYVKDKATGKDKGDPKMREALIEINRLKFTRPRAEVEAEIQARYARNMPAKFKS